MATMTRPSQPLAHYWGMVKNWDDSLKLELVEMLVNSMRIHTVSPITDEAERERAFRSLAGCWAKDEGDDDVETILRRSRTERQGSRMVPSFDD